MPILTCRLSEQGQKGFEEISEANIILDTQYLQRAQNIRRTNYLILYPVSPSKNVIDLKMKQPSTANIKYTKNKRLDTFIRAGSENTIVAINLYIPCRFFTSFNNLETLKTLNILINYGANEKLLELFPYKINWFTTKSIKDAVTINRSNLL